MSLPELDLPDALPGDEPTVSVRLNSDWLTYVIGACEEMLNPIYWRGDDATVSEAIRRVHDLLALLMFPLEEVCEVAGLGDVVWSTSSSRENYLPCDGRLLENADVDYPELFAVIDSIYLEDGVNVRLPDLRDKSIIGAGGNYVIGDSGGSDEVVIQEQNLARHFHVENAGSARTRQFAVDGEVFESAVTGFMPANTRPVGLSEPLNVRNPYHALMPLMRVR